MDDNVYYIACASAVMFIIWKVVEIRYVRKSEFVIKPIVVDAISVFVSVVAGSYIVASAISNTTHVVGVFTSEPGF